MLANVQVLVNYYARERFPRLLQECCEQVLKNHAADWEVKFWRAFGMVMDGNISDALYELKTLQGKEDIAPAVTAAMLFAYQSPRTTPDYDAIDKLEAQLADDIAMAAPPAIRLLASFYAYSGSLETGRGHVETLLSDADAVGGQDHASAKLLAWIMLAQQHDELGLADDSEVDEALQLFEAALAAHPNDADAMLGKAKVYELKDDFSAAIDIVGEVHVRNDWCVPALTEKAKLLMAMGDWDDALETCQRILQVDRTNFTAMHISALHALVRAGDNGAALTFLRDLEQCIQQYEPRNARLAFALARAFSRLAGHDARLLEASMRLATMAAGLEPHTGSYACEVARQLCAQGRYKESMGKYEAAMTIDESGLDATYGKIECQILAGSVAEAVVDLQEIKQISSSTADPALLAYLDALIVLKGGHPDDLEARSPSPDDVARYVEKAIQRMQESVGELPIGLEFYVKLNVSGMLQIVELFLHHVGGEPRGATEVPHAYVTKSIRILEVLGKFVPGLLEAQMLLAKAHFLNGNLEVAHRKCTDILRANPQEHSAQLLVAHIFLHQGRPQAAVQALDQALSANFVVREHPMYHLINAKVLVAENKLEEARKALQAAFALPGVKTKMPPESGIGGGGKRRIQPTLHERVSIYLLLAEVESRMSTSEDAPEASALIAQAEREFEGTSEEVHVLIANCELSINKKQDIEGALKKLRAVDAKSPFFVKARIAMADIYLTHRHDQAAYIKCYLDLVDKYPHYDEYIMLGEAYMAIQEPERAIDAYEAALRQKPKNSELASKIGAALVTTHAYRRAIDYYNKAIRADPANVDLQHELASLFRRLREFERAEEVLVRALQRRRVGEAAENLMIDIKTKGMIIEVRRDANQMSSYVEDMQEMLELQTQLLSKLRGEHPDTVKQAREKAADICCDLAEFYRGARKFDLSKENYEQALRHMDVHSKSMLALAKLHLAEDNGDKCQWYCTQLLQHDQDNEDASIMLAELEFYNGQYDQAIFHFQQLLEKHPTHYGALAQLIRLLRQAGRGDEIPKYIKQAARANTRAIPDAGLHYARGLQHRYANEPREALKEFNAARVDPEFATKAIFAMVELYINPDNDAVWEEKEDERDGDEIRDAIAAAHTLLGAVPKADQNSTQYKVLYAYALMTSKQKDDVEAALSSLLDLANADPNNVPVLLAMATGFMMLRQVPKARNQLKRVSKIPFKADEAEQFERAWLLLADLHIQGGKFDLAQDLCKKCLKYNKSCSKAWEHMGLIMEKEQSYKDAAENYENAWKYEAETSAVIGYKLAFNYLKAKRFVEAVDVCHKVLKAFPDYPRIQKDIMVKAWENLRS